jgi:hypothetical protein
LLLETVFTGPAPTDPEHDLVVVRWIQDDQLDGFVQRVLASLT